MRFHRWIRGAAVLAALAVFAPVSMAWPLDWPAFTREAFSAAQSEGKTIVVFVSADWCSTCRAQEPGLLEATSRPEHQGYELFLVDYDTQKDVMRELGVPVRSTILVYRGPQEVGRIVSDSSIDAIVDLFSFGLPG